MIYSHTTNFFHNTLWLKWHIKKLNVGFSDVKCMKNSWYLPNQKRDNYILVYKFTCHLDQKRKFGQWFAKKQFKFVRKKEKGRNMRPKRRREDPIYTVFFAVSCIFSFEIEQVLYDFCEILVFQTCSKIAYRKT